MIEKQWGPFSWISSVQRWFSLAANFSTVQWHPPVLWVGIGCKRGSSRQLIEFAVQEVCREAHLAEAAIAGVATLDLKADEEGLVEFCADRALPLWCFSAEQLRSMPVPTPTAIVEAKAGTPSVAEAAALWAATEVSTGSSAGAAPNGLPAVLRVSKTIVKQAGQPGAVTVAIAQANRAYLTQQSIAALVGANCGSPIPLPTQAKVRSQGQI